MPASPRPRSRISSWRFARTARRWATPPSFTCPARPTCCASAKSHIALLERELAAKDDWLEKAQADLAEFDREHRKLMEELEQSNRWAEELNRELAERRARVAELQEELASEQENARRMAEGYAAKVAALEEENREKTRWAVETDARLSAEIRRQTEHLATRRGGAAPHGEGAGGAHRLGAAVAGRGSARLERFWRCCTGPRDG